MEVPFALSIHKFVNSVGADVGFAAFIAVAILVVLYFAQARETATLRDRLDEAHERIGGLEARVAQLLHLQARQQGAPVATQQQRAAPAVTPPPATVRPMGSAIASVRRVPSAAATAAAAAGEGGVTTLPAAPVGMGAPALASATKLIPDPALPAPPAASDDTMVVPAAPSNGHSELPVAPASTATAAAARRVSPAVPPPVQIRPEGSGAGPVPRRTVTPSRPRPEERFEVFDHDDGGGLRNAFQGRLAPLAIAVIAVLVIAIGGVVISTSGSGGGTPTPASGSGTNGGKSANTTPTSKTNNKPKVPVFNPATVTVAVLNGTDVGGLAADVGTDLGKSGYKQGNITNAATGSMLTTIVYYKAPKFHAAALKVAASLKLGRASVQAATQQAIQSCGTTPTGAKTTCKGDVIVAVGADRKSLATGSSSSAG